MKNQLITRQVEKYATFFKRLGFSVAFGKIFGYLISSNPPFRTFDQIVHDLKLSKGSVSMVLRAMEQHGYVDYFIRAGERKRFFRISLKKWKQGLQKKLDDSEGFCELLRESLFACHKTHEEHRNTIRQFLEFEKLSQTKVQEIIDLCVNRRLSL